MDPNLRRFPRLGCDFAATWRRGRWSYPARVRSFNYHGAFLETEPAAEVNYIIDVTAEMPWGAVEFTAVPRFLGRTPFGNGIGLEIHVMEKGDLERWAAHYRRTRERASTTIPTPVASARLRMGAIEQLL